MPKFMNMKNLFFLNLQFLQRRIAPGMMPEMVTTMTMTQMMIQTKAGRMSQSIHRLILIRR